MIELILEGGSNSVGYMAAADNPLPRAFAIGNGFPDTDIGVVMSIYEYNGRLYVGTTKGAWIDDTNLTAPAVPGNALQRIFSITDWVNDIIVDSTGIYMATKTGLYVGALNLVGSATRYDEVSSNFPSNNVQRIRKSGSRYIAGFASLVHDVYSVYYNDTIGTPWTLVTLSGNFGDISDLHTAGPYVFAITASIASSDTGTKKILYSQDSGVNWALSAEIQISHIDRYGGLFTPSLLRAYPVKHCITTNYTSTSDFHILIGGEYIVTFHYSAISPSSFKGCNMVASAYKGLIGEWGHYNQTVGGLPFIWKKSNPVRVMVYNPSTQSMYAGGGVAALRLSHPVGAVLYPTCVLCAWHIPPWATGSPEQFITWTVAVPGGSGDDPAQMFALANASLPTTYSISTASDFISIGEGWKDGSGNVELTTDIVLLPATINAANYLFNGFNAHFNFGGYKISIKHPGIGTANLSKSLVTDLSGGHLYDLVLDVSGVKVNYGGTYPDGYNAGILVSLSDTFSSGGSYGPTGAIDKVSLTMTNCQLGQPANSFLLPKYFGNNAKPLHHTTLSSIEITGPGNTSGNRFYQGIVGTYMFDTADSTCLILITGLTNTIELYAQTMGVLGDGFANNTGATVQIFDCSNSGAISGESAGSLVSNSFQGFSGTLLIGDCRNYGPITGQYAGGILGGGGLSGGTCKNNSGQVSINGCLNHGSIVETVGYGRGGGIVGNNFGFEQTGNIVLFSCANYGSILAPQAGGIIGNGCGYQSSGTIQVTDCVNVAPIGLAAKYSGGVVGRAFGESATGGIFDVSGCTNLGDISGEYCGGVVGFGFGNQSDNCTLTIRSCDNSGNILATTAGGIAPAQFGYQLAEGHRIDVSGCRNYGAFETQNIGGIIGSHCGQNSSGTIIISNCSNYSDVSGGIISNTGGIVGEWCGLSQQPSGTLTIQHCTNVGDITGEQAGGIAGAYFGGQAQGLFSIADCSNTGTITGIVATGGIVGLTVGLETSASISITNCNNFGRIEIGGGITGDRAGGWMNVGATLDISGCANHGPFFISYLDGLQGGIVGRFAGQGNEGTILIRGCSNSQDVSSNYAGGIVGLYGGRSQTSTASFTVTDCNNDGDVTGSYAGGIVGSSFGLHAAGSLTVTNCSNSGSITGVYASGIVASCTDLSGCTLTISDCGSTGSFTGSNRTAGITSIRRPPTLPSFTPSVSPSVVAILDNTVTAVGTSADNASWCINEISDIDADYVVDILIRGNASTMTLENCSGCSGILNNMYNVQDCSVNIVNNAVTMSTISDSCSSIGGIMCIDTKNPTSSNRTFYLVADISLNISDNTVNAYVPNMFQHKNNGTIFGTNTDIDPGTKPYNVSGTLIVMRNMVNTSQAIMEKFTHVSSLSIPVHFRPYILKGLSAYPDSNYWFDAVTTDIPRDIVVVTTIINEDFEDINDAMLRDIFTRSLTAIIEQNWFPVFELYNRRVIAQRTDVRKEITTRTEVAE